MEIFLNLNQSLQIVVIALFGLIIGSFISLVSHRLVSKEAIIWGRSQCPSCKTNLKVRSLIPLISWIIQRGKCLNCSTKISIRYPLIEFFCALGFVITYFILGQKIDIKLMIYLAIYTTLLIMIVVDLEHYFIPDILQFILAFLVTLLIINFGGVNSVFKAILPAIAYVGFGFAIWLFFYFSAGVNGIGIDDFKFFLVAGFALGINNLILFMFLTGILGSVFGGLWQKFKNDETFPFAPAICLSLYICLLIGKPIL